MEGLEEVLFGGCFRLFQVVTGGGCWVGVSLTLIACKISGSFLRCGAVYGKDNPYGTSNSTCLSLVLNMSKLNQI